MLCRRVVTIASSTRFAIRTGAPALDRDERSGDHRRMPTDRQRFAEKAAFPAQRRVRPSVYTMDKPLYAGESYLLSWDRIPHLAFRNANPDARDIMTSWGFQRFQYAQADLSKLAFGHELLRPYVEKIGNDLQVRHAHGALLFKPLMNDRFADSLYAPPVNVAVGGEGRTLRPAKAGKPAELLYLVQTPYVIVDSQLAGTFLVGPGGKAKVSIALADWRTLDYTLDQVIPAKPQWKVVWESSGTGRQSMGLYDNDLKLRGEYKFLVKVEMFAPKEAATVEVSGLGFVVRFQEGVMALPRLLPGRNVIRLTAGRLKPGYRLRVTYAWDDLAGPQHTTIHTADRLPMHFQIDAAGTQPADVRSRGVILEAVHETDKEPPAGIDGA